MTTTQEAELVILDYEEVTGPSSSNNNQEATSLLARLDKAFGSQGFGIIGIRNVPGFVQAKQDVLSLAHPLAHLGESQLKELEDPASLYNAGWSHGREKLRKDVPDTAKASFYFNPITDTPGTADDRAQYPVSYPPNKWPSAGLPALEPAAKHLGCLMKEVAVHLAKHIDAYASQQNKEYPPDTLYKTMKDTEKVKGRLLYYYPLEEQQHQGEADSWNSWHNDSGFLTALAGDLYLTPSGTMLEASPCPNAGLYITDRKDVVRKITIPKDCMAIQIGECTQIITGGAVVATPHCVQGAPNLARASLACFIDTPPTFPLNIPNPDQMSQLSATSTSSRVPPLLERWKDGMTFGDFLGATFQMYYDYNNNS